MKPVLTSLVLAALLCACSSSEDDTQADVVAVDDATIGTPPPGDPDNASDQAPTPPPTEEDARDGAGDDAGEAEVPARYRGEWAATAEACDRQGEVSQLVIGDDSIRFHESEGPVVSLVERGNELTLLARLTGEGETRDASYTYHLSADGNTLTDLNGFARQRCD